MDILIPIDGSDLSRRILGPVRRLLTVDDDVAATLLHVLAPDAGPVERAAAEADLRGLAGLLSAGGIRGRVEVVAGDPAGEIIAMAEARRPGLVAMASHGRTGLTRLVRGSVAERVLRRCPSPLLLCNPRSLDRPEPQTPAFRRILVPLDGSALAARVLDGVAVLARAFDSEVLLFVVENFAAGGGHPRLLSPEEAVQALAPTRARLEALGVRRVEVHAVIGAAADEILAAVTRLGADLVAMTTHGRSGPARWWLGSVAEAVARECAAPLYVVRVGHPSELE